MEAYKKRISIIDELRGILILFVVVYHFFYDLVYLFEQNIEWFKSDITEYARIGTVIGLMIIAGISCRFSKHNMKRGLILLGLGLMLTIATMVFMPTQLIIFGILHFFGLSIIIFAILEPIIDKIKPKYGMILSISLFILTYNISKGYLGTQNFKIQLPEILYKTNLLSPIGLYNPYFSSADYYPLLPWFFALLFGVYLGKNIEKIKYYPALYKNHSKILSYIGKNTMIIYIIHQPIIYTILYLYFTFNI